jgi:microcystin-dependent protein
MTIINADVRDSRGQPLPGYIRVSLRFLLPRLATTYTPVPATFPLVGGLATLDLPPTLTERTTYLFEVVQVSGPNETVVLSFDAQVPDSATAISFNDLAHGTGVARDNQDTSITAVARRLYSDAGFWAALGLNLFQFRGDWSPVALYRRGDWVYHSGGSYAYKGMASVVNQVPESGGVVNTLYWQKVAASGTGSGTANGAAYGAGWSGQADAPSRGAIWAAQFLQATALDNPAMVAPTVTGTIPPADSTQRVASTQWVQARIAPLSLGAMPVGSVLAYAGANVPAGYQWCDGRAINRTTFSLLFTAIGTTYGVGNGTSTFNLPDLRGRMPAGADNMNITTGAAGRLTLATRGATGGQETRVLTVGQLPAHAHGLAYISGGSYTAPGSQYTAATNGSTGTNYGSTQNLGNGDPVSTLNPAQAVNYIIYAGV